MRDINAIFADLQLCSLKNPALAEHLEKMRFYLRENNSEKILLCIQEGVSKFKTNSMLVMFSANTNKYADFLVELRKNFVIKSPKNSRKRFVNLLRAIQAN